MEYAGFGTLHDLWDLENQSKIPLTTRIRMALEIAQALKHVHEMKIFHRGNVTNILQIFGFLLSEYFKIIIIKLLIRTGL